MCCWCLEQNIITAKKTRKRGKDMWSQELFGTELIYLVECFILYSFLGWVVESIYMSICNRRLKNRGFAFGPFCPIYGCGGVIGNMIMHPLSGHLIGLYLFGAVLATVFEYLVGILMQRLFHEVWWDYNEKPFNYKGIICLESTLAWGFYAIIIVRFLNNRMMNLVYRVPLSIGVMLCKIVIAVYALDFFYHMIKALGVQDKISKEKIVNVYHSLRARFW